MIATLDDSLYMPVYVVFLLPCGVKPLFGPPTHPSARLTLHKVHRLGGAALHFFYTSVIIGQNASAQKSHDLTLSLQVVLVWT